VSTPQGRFPFDQETSDQESQEVIKPKMLFARTSSSARDAFRFKLAILAAAGIVCLLISILLKDSYHEDAQKQLIFLTGQAAAHTSAAETSSLPPGSRNPPNPLANKSATLFSELEQEDHIVADLIRDLGVALLIAVIVTIVIEKYSSDRLRESIALDVISAAYMKVVPSEIYTEIADNIFRSDVCRRKWKINIKAERWLSEQRAKHVAIVSSVTTYDVENLNNHPIRFEVSGGIDNDIDMEGMGCPFPRFDSIKIANSPPKNGSAPSRDDTGTLLDVTIPPKDSEKVLTREGQTIDYRYKNLVLVLESTHQQIRFGVPVTIPAGQTIGVEFKSARGIRVPGSIVLYATAPADGIDITVKSDENEIKFRVIPLHPNRNALKPDSVSGVSPSGEWHFESGILPWQGFQLKSDP
jgi:hypothetical protein